LFERLLAFAVPEIGDFLKSAEYKASTLLRRFDKASRRILSGGRMNLSQLFTEKRTLLLSIYYYLFIFFIFWTRPLRTRNVEGKTLDRTGKNSF
jgi:hypothetical protein